jgi:hypothetical protein
VVVTLSVFLLKLDCNRVVVTSSIFHDPALELIVLAFRQANPVGDGCVSASVSCIVLVKIVAPLGPTSPHVDVTAF